MSICGVAGTGPAKSARPGGSLLGASAIMMVATVLSGVFNFAFQILMNHRLTEPDFADFSALVSLLVILSVPGMAIQTVVARRVAYARSGRDPGAVPRLVVTAMKVGFLTGGALALILGGINNIVASFFDVSFRPVIITALSLWGVVLVPVLYGTMQGEELFRSWGVNTVSGGLSRLLSGAVLVWLGARVSGAVGASGVSSFVCIVMALAALRFIFRGHRSDASPADARPWTGVWHDVWPVFAAFLCLQALWFSDLLLVKHFFAKRAAADYAAASVLGRSAVYLALPIGMVVLPKASRSAAQGEAHEKYLWKGLLYAGLACGLASLVLASFPWLVAKVFLKQTYVTAVPVLRLLALALTPVALTGVVVHYELALWGRRLLWVIGPGVLLHIGLMTLFHGTLLQVLAALAASGTIILGSLLISWRMGWLGTRVKRAGRAPS